MKLYRHMILALTSSISIIPVQAIGWPTSQVIKACLSRPKELLTGACHIASSAGKSLFAHKAATTALAAACAILSFPKTRKALLLAPFRASFALARRINDAQLFVGTLRLALWLKMDRVTDIQKYLKQTNLEFMDYICDVTPLHLATEEGHLEIVQALITAGANIEATDHQGNTPLHLAVNHGHLKVVQALVNAGANKDTPNKLGCTPLHLAVNHGHLKVVQALVNAGAKKDATTMLDETPLHLAAEKGHLEVVRALVNAGANKDATTILGKTPLHLAAENGHLKVVQALITAGANIATQDHAQQTALDIAQANGKQDVVNYLSNVPQLARDLQKAVQESNLANVTELLEAGAPATVPDEQGNTTIHLSIGDYERANPTTSDTCTRTLLRYVGPAALTLRDWQGQTPLHIAATKGNCWIAEYLLRRRPELIHERDNVGNTPLHYATSPAMCKKLLRHGANASLINHDGQTPLLRNPCTWQDLWQHG